MIDVLLNLSGASRAEVEAFLAMPGVARAVDSLSHVPAALPVRFRVLEPAPAEPPGPQSFD